MSVVLYISSYRFTRYLVSDGSDKISVFPKFSTPQLSLYLRIPQKYLSCTHALQNPHYFSNRISGRNARKYVHMILGYLNLLYLTVSRCQYLFKQLLYRISYLFFQYPLAILRCPYKMVSRIIYRMAHSFEGHAVYYTQFLKKGNPFLPVLPHGGIQGLFFMKLPAHGAEYYDSFRKDRCFLPH